MFAGFQMFVVEVGDSVGKRLVLKEEQRYDSFVCFTEAGNNGW
jgi:hypothetical protein